MKKLNAFLAVTFVVSSLAVTSCKKGGIVKDYTCKCSWSSGGASSTRVLTISSTSESEAKTKCSSSSQQNGEVCLLK